MPQPSKQQILRLYKHLIKYGNQLYLTDKSYFLERIRNEFRSNRNLSKPDDILFSFKEKHCSRMAALCKQGLSNIHNITTRPIQFLALRYKATLDYTRYPKLDETELEETFVRGSGPGGQAVNKTSNCVMLRHIPTNIVIKCHTHRIASRNREEARKILLNKLDILYNGELSISAQQKVIDAKKSAVKTRRQKKLAELKEMWKNHENDTSK